MGMAFLNHPHLKVPLKNVITNQPIVDKATEDEMSEEVPSPPDEANLKI
jgi:hypothetical protein